VTASIQADSLIPHAPARVWRALTDRSLLARWLMPNTFGEATVGHTFTFDAGQWGTVRCEVLEVVPQKKLSVSWKNPPLDTVVTWTLVPEAGGTRLFLEHSGFDLDHPMMQMAHQQMGEGWRRMLAGRIAAAIEAEAA
jgi:uncharacterized protein YndB with AHSA1/START domain